MEQYFLTSYNDFFNDSYKIIFMKYDNRFYIDLSTVSKIKESKWDMHTIFLNCI